MSVTKWPWPTGPWSAGPTGVTGPVSSYGDSSPWEDTKKRDLAFKFVMGTLTDEEVVQLEFHFRDEADRRVQARDKKHRLDAVNYVTKGV